MNSEEKFQEILDKHTERLQNKIPSHSWGIARKVLNIFLFEAAHNVVLNRNYNFDKIVPFLEVPLDNPNAQKLRKYAKSGVLHWTNISSLKRDASMKFQEYATQYAQEHNCERCYLDLYWWRG